MNEEIFKELALARNEGSSELVKDLEENIISDYLLVFRRELEENETIKQMIIESNPAVSAKEKILPLLLEFNKFGTEDLLERAVTILLEELDNLRLKKPSLYLIDEKTGRTVSALSKELIFTPPDYVGEDGITRTSRPMVHPALSSALGLMRYEKSKLSKLPRTLTFQHVHEPDQILVVANRLLKSNGIKKPTSKTKEEIIEIGREHYDADFQSTNNAFHRFNMFGILLAKKLIALVGDKASGELKSIKLKKNSKHRWFEVTVNIPI